MNETDEKINDKMDRRKFLEDTSALVTGSGLASILAERGLAQPVETSAPSDATVFNAETDASSQTVFPQSVASGGPTPGGVLLWTRINSETHRQEQPLAIEVAADRSFEQPVHRGVIASEEITPAHDYTVSVDLDGVLSANNQYFYRFTYGGVRSRTGRCQTLPHPDASPESIKCAVLSCQDYQNGYYGAYSHVAREEVDFLLHLGDFIYESAAGQYRTPWSGNYPDRSLDLPSGHDLAYTLEDYRYLYNTYRSDPFLQRALEQHTLIAGWDDHEVANNRYWDYDTDSPKLPPYPNGDNPSFATRVTAAGIQAWVEQMPARIEYNPDTDDLHEQFVLQRSFQFGDLATLVLTDERLFRDPPPSEADGNDPNRTMLGTDQLQWFLNEIDASQTTWNVWANEVLTMSLKIGAADVEYYLNRDAWDGYRNEREQIMTHLAHEDVDNFITLTGDFHTFMAGYQQTGYDLFENETEVGVEFMTPAVTSVNLGEIVPGSETLSWFDITERAVTSTNHNIECFDSTEWGYSVVEFTPNECIYTVYSVDKTVNTSDAEKRRLRTLRVPEGKIEIETVSPE
jgi:alkaline phosphatase D